MAKGFVNAYAKTTGRKHRIPAHWLTHPTLGAAFRKTPKQRAKDSTTTDPDAPSANPATEVTLTGIPDLDSTTSTTAPSDTDPAAEPKE